MHLSALFMISVIFQKSIKQLKYIVSRRLNTHIHIFMGLSFLNSFLILNCFFAINILLIRNTLEKFINTLNLFN
jgi:hypothetical protein